MNLFRTVTSVAIILLTDKSMAGAPVDTNFIQLDRYSLQSRIATEQSDLLSTDIHVRFPEMISTVGAAIDYLLQRSGYRRLNNTETNAAMSLPLPRAHRKLGPWDLRTALTTIAGSSWEMHENPELRVIWFQIAGSEPLMPEQLTDTLTAEPPTGTPTESILSLSPEQVSQWTVNPSKTLRGNIADWAAEVGWSLEWNSRHDYEIGHSASLEGSFPQVVEQVLKYYQNAPIPLTASFFRTNRVLLVEPERRE